MFNFLKKKINSNDEKVNVEKLLKKYGKCRSLDSHINILVITDTHGFLSYKDELKEQLKSVEENSYDICCCLGDITYSDYEEILKYVPDNKIVSILGNHDEFEIIDSFHLKNLNGKVINVNGVKIGGIEGSWRYKNENFPSFTHQESIDFLNELEPVDILISHTGPFWNANKNPVHNGLKGITEYLYKNQVPLNIHGHNHVSEELYLNNGTHVKECYLIELLKI